MSKIEINCCPVKRGDNCDKPLHTFLCNQLGDSCNNPQYVKICDPFIGIEQGIVPVGCLRNEEGDVVGRVYTVVTVNEDTPNEFFVTNIAIMANGDVVNPFTASFEQCDRDYEYKFVENCYQSVSDRNIKYTQITCIPMIDADIVADEVSVFWVNPDGSYTPNAPAIELTPCSDCLGSQECIESQEYTFAIDNTGTHWGWNADYEIEWSDGRVTPFSQVGAPPADNWSGQMASQWAPNLKTSIASQSISAYVSVRFRNNNDDTDLSGIPPQGNAPAIPGPPSEYVSKNLGAVSWRYINIQICPGEATPVDFRLVRVTNNNGHIENETPRSLITAGPILGKIEKFIKCQCCGEKATWYLSDGVTVAELGQIPSCVFPCGTLVLADSPAEPNCSFETVVGCDDTVGNGIVTDAVKDITRIYQLCPNTPPELFGYFQTIDGALVPYKLVGIFVDCDTLLPVDPPSFFCCPDYLTFKDYYSEAEAILPLADASGDPTVANLIPDFFMELGCHQVIAQFDGTGSVRWSSNGQLGLSTNVGNSVSTTFVVPEGTVLKFDLTNINAGAETFSLATTPDNVIVSPSHSWDGSTLSWNGDPSGAPATSFEYSGGQSVTITADCSVGTVFTQIIANIRLCYGTCSTAGLVCNDDGTREWRNVETCGVVSDCAVGVSCPIKADVDFGDVVEAIEGQTNAINNSISSQTASLTATLTAGFASVVSAIQACCATTNVNLDAIEAILAGTQSLTQSIDSKLQDFCHVCKPEKTCRAYNGSINAYAGATGDQTLLGWYGNTTGAYAGPFGDDPFTTPLVWYNASTGMIPNVEAKVSELIKESLNSTNNPTGQSYDVSEVTVTVTSATRLAWTAWRCSTDSRALSMGVSNKSTSGSIVNSTLQGGTRVEPAVLAIRTDIGCTDHEPCNCGGEG